MVNQHVILGGVGHRHPSHGFRPDPEDFEAATAELAARGHTVGTYLRACLRWVGRDPDAALAAVAACWPGPRPTGRPPRDGQPGDNQPSTEPETSV